MTGYLCLPAILDNNFAADKFEGKFPALPYYHCNELQAHGAWQQQEIPQTQEELPRRSAVIHNTMQTSESGLPLQAGRSLSGLHAERAANLLDGTGVRTRDKSSSTLADPRRSLDGQDQCLSANNHTSRPITPTPRDAPLSRDICASDQSRLEGTRSLNGELNTQSKFLEGSRSSTSALQTPAGRPVRRGLQAKTHVQSLLDCTSQSEFDLQRTTCPLTVHDLGLDYTRYYDPFTDATRNSLPDRLSRSSTRPSSRLSQCQVHTIGTGTTTTPATATPSDSTTKLVEGTSTGEIFLIDDRLGAPFEETDGLVWPLWGDEAEDDDAMHLPHPDDDRLFKMHWKERFSKENIIPSTGVFLMLLGLFIIFIGLPILTFTGVINITAGYETPLEKIPHSYPSPQEWAWVNDYKYPLFHHMRSGLIDPFTPKDAMKKIGEFGDEYELVFSDEFNDNNRTFYEGDDPFFFAPDIWYGATQDLEWYDPDAVTTWDGVLELRLDKFKNHGLEFRSGMLNSWNQLCFKGGIFEVSMSLPGPAGVHGLWPGVWTLGNLGRPGYTSTTDGTWPYTYQACDVGITPNQSSPDGISWLPGQRLPSCTCPGEDHPSPGTGRGAPEIDIAEMSVSYDENLLPVATQSYQVAPFDIWYYPDYDFTAFPDQQLSYTNSYTGGPYQQAISATTNLNRDWYDGKAYQRFSFEYVPGDKKNSHITWKVGGQTMFTMDGRALGPNGNIQARQISQEPMSLVLNLGISNSWTWINWPELVFPAVLQVDYIRWYQKKGEKMVTCDPPGFETTQYIKEHMDAYKNPNFTVSVITTVLYLESVR